MAFIKCSGGGKLKETVLWTNPSPTSAFTGSGTLSQSITNFDYIKIIFRMTTSDSTRLTLILNASEISSYSSDYPQYNPAVEYRKSGSPQTYRFITFGSNTKINFTNGIVTGTSSNNNSVIIPTTIYGMKY